MTPYDLGRASCVCRKWRYTVRNPVFWRNACLKAWQVNLVLLMGYETISIFVLCKSMIFKTSTSMMKVSGVVENYKVLQSKYEGSWRKMWLLRPRVRTDGKVYPVLSNKF